MKFLYVKLDAFSCVKNGGIYKFDFEDDDLN